MKPINDGSRPSLLELGRRATGETEGDLPDAYARELEEARSRVAPFDWEILRAASWRVDDEARPARARPAPAWRWVWGLVPVMAAALAMVAVLVPGPHTRSRGEGEARIDAILMRDGEMITVDDDTPLLAGDRVQFTYAAAGRSTLVLLSIDGAGTLTVFWPESGDEPEPVRPGDTALLAGSVEVDDAPGPEVFVGLFGFDSVETARDLALDAWERDGVDGLWDLALDRADVDVIVMERAP